MGSKQSRTWPGHRPPVAAHGKFTPQRAVHKSTRHSESILVLLTVLHAVVGIGLLADSYLRGRANRRTAPSAPRLISWQSSRCCAVPLPPSRQRSRSIRMTLSRTTRRISNPTLLHSAMSRLSHTRSPRMAPWCSVPRGKMLPQSFCASPRRPERPMRLFRAGCRSRASWVGRCLHARAKLASNLDPRSCI